MPTLKLELTNIPDPDDMRTVEVGLKAFNAQHASDDHYEPLCIFLRDEGGTVVGGLLGNTYWRWLSISIVWLHENTRGSGYGTQMIAMAEAEAIRRDCLYAHVDTMDFQVLDFYLKLGYAVWGQLDDLPPGHTRYFLKKTFTASTEG